MFKGKQATLKSYLTLIDIYIRINILSGATKPDKVIFAGTYLKGLVFTWFKPYIRDFNKNKTNK